MRRWTILLALAVLTLGRGAFGQELKERATFRVIGRIASAALSPDGKKLATSIYKQPIGEVAVWHVPSGKEIINLPLKGKNPASVRFSPDGKQLAVAVFPEVMVWDLTTHKLLATLKTNIGSSGKLAFSPDGKKLGVETQLWDLTSGKMLSSFRRSGESFPVAIRPDLRILAAGNAQEIDLWDMETGKRRAILSEHRGRVSRMAYSSDGKTLVAASCLDRGRWNYVGDVRLWNVATGKTRAVFQKGIAFVSSVCLSPDGKTLALLNRKSFLADGYADLKILDVATGKPRILYSTPNHTFAFVTFTTDGRLFLIDNPNDETIKLWEVLLGKKGAPPSFTPGNAGAR